MKTKSKSIVRAQSRLMRRIRIAKILAMFGLMLISVRAAEEASSTDSAGKDVPDLIDRPIEDLLKTRVRSVSKKSEKLFEAAAAIDVITSEDIRRSGVTSIPEALRLSPGLEVARQDA